MDRTARSAVLIVLLSVMVSLPAVAFQAMGGTIPSADITFEASAPYYRPQQAVITAGTPIRWINVTASHHSVRHDGCLTEEACAFQSIALSPDSSFLIAPLPPGRYDYHCELHPIMRGTLIVTDSDGPDTASVAVDQWRN